jgi:hypothetical protein
VVTGLVTGYHYFLRRRAENMKRQTSRDAKTIADTRNEESIRSEIYVVLHTKSKTIVEYHTLIARLKTLRQALRLKG